MQDTNMRLRGAFRATTRRRGSVLLLALFFGSLLALLAGSFGESVRAQVQNAREVNASLESELAAQSGLEFALRRLLWDPTWQGTLDPVQIGNGASFRVLRSDPGDDYAIHTAQLEIVANDGTSEYRLATAVEVTPGDPLRNKAITALGNKVRYHNLDVHGDMILVDARDKVWDWSPALQDWVPAGPHLPAKSQLSSVDVVGTLYKYQENSSYLHSGQERTWSRDLRMPAWSLDAYLVPDPSDRKIYHRPAELSGITLNKTAVVILEPGDNLVLDDARLLGGLIVHVPALADLRLGPAVTITLKNSNEIGTGVHGIHPNIGLIAPGAMLQGNTGATTKMDGFTFLGSTNTTVHLDVDGMLILVNEVKNLNDAEITFDKKVAENPPMGITFSGPIPAVDVATMHESYGDLNLDY